MVNLNRHNRSRSSHSTPSQLITENDQKSHYNMIHGTLGLCICSVYICHVVCWRGSFSFSRMFCLSLLQLYFVALGNDLIETLPNLFCIPPRSKYGNSAYIWQQIVARICPRNMHLFFPLRSAITHYIDEVSGIKISKNKGIYLHGPLYRK